MTKKDAFRLTARSLIMSTFIALLLLNTSFGFAFEEEFIILEKENQTKNERKRYKDRFVLNLSFTYGYYSRTKILSEKYILDYATRIYLERLDMDTIESTNPLSITATAVYLINSKMSVYLTVPSGVFFTYKETGTARAFEEPGMGVGLGDISGGINYYLLPENRNRPGVFVGLNVDSDTATNYLFGDGLWSFTLGVRISKLLTKKIYVFGSGGYTHRLEKNNVRPGRIISYGGGIGFISKGSREEFSLRKTQINKTYVDNSALFGKTENTVLIISLTDLIKNVDINYYFSFSSDGFSFKSNSIGVEAVFKL